MYICTGDRGVALPGTSICIDVCGWTWISLTIPHTFLPIERGKSTGTHRVYTSHTLVVSGNSSSQGTGTSR